MMADQAKNAIHFGNNAIQKPKGSKELPGRSCRHLKEANPELKDGELIEFHYLLWIL